MAAVPKFEGKQHIQEFADLWAPYTRVHLKWSNFDSDQEWCDNTIFALNHAANGNRQFKADVRKLRKGKKIPVEQVVDKLLKKYESALLAQQLAIRERVCHFPWDIQKRDGKGRVIYPENTKLSWPKIDDRLDRLTMDAGEIDMEVTVKKKKEMVIQALTPDQQRGLLSDIKKQHPHMRVADLTQISWEVIEEWMVWYTSFERKGPTKEKPKERANRAEENGDHRPRCHWCQRRGHFMNKCRDKAAGKPRVPPPGLSQSG